MVVFWYTDHHCLVDVNGVYYDIGLFGWLHKLPNGDESGWCKSVCQCSLHSTACWWAAAGEWSHGLLLTSKEFLATVPAVAISRLFRARMLPSQLGWKDGHLRNTQVTTTILVSTGMLQDRIFWMGFGHILYWSWPVMMLTSMVLDCKRAWCSADPAAATLKVKDIGRTRTLNVLMHHHMFLSPIQLKFWLRYCWHKASCRTSYGHSQWTKSWSWDEHVNERSIGMDITDITMTVKVLWSNAVIGIPSEAMSVLLLWPATTVCPEAQPSFFGRATKPIWEGRWKTTQKPSNTPENWAFIIKFNMSFWEHSFGKGQIWST